MVQNTNQNRLKGILYSGALEFLHKTFVMEKYRRKNYFTAFASKHYVYKGNTNVL